MKIKYSFVLFTVFCLFSAVLFAQKDSSSIKLDEVIISAGRIEQSINKIPASASIINTKYLKIIPLSSIDDAMRAVSGVNIVRPFGIFGKSNVSLRGFGGNEQGRILVLQDGVPINKSDLGGVNWNRFNPSNVSKIEIVRGPGSSFFGKSAMGGVINILTQDYSKNVISGNINLNYGTFNTYSVNAGISGTPFKNKKFKYKINSFYRKSDGYISQIDSLRDSTNIASWCEEFGIDLSKEYKLNKNNKINFSYNYYNDKRSQGIKIKDKIGNAVDHDTHFFRSKYQGHSKNISWNANVYFQNEQYLRTVEKIKKQVYSMYNVNSSRKDFGFTGNISHKTSRNTLSAGFDLKKGIVNGSDEYKTSTDIIRNIGDINNYSIFLNNDFKIIEKLFVNATLHYDYTFLNKAEFIIEKPTNNSNFLLNYQSKISNKNQNSFSPKISLLFLNDFLKTYMSYSTGFRAPTLDDLSRTGFIAGAFKIANPELKSENVDNYELGTTFSKKKIKIEISTYLTRGKNFMYYTETGDVIFGKKPIVMKENITEVELYGFESSIIFSFNEYFNGFLNYSYSKSKIMKFSKKPDLEGKVLNYSPNHNLQTGLRIQAKNITFSTSFTYLSEQFIDNANTTSIPKQYLLDFKMSKSLKFGFEVSVSIQNALNKKYLIYSDQESIGRFINFGLGYSF